MNDNLIREIRAVAGEWRNAGLSDEDAMRRVCAILDGAPPLGSATPAPRVCECGHAKDDHTRGRGVCYPCFGASDHGMKPYCSRLRWASEERAGG